MKCFKQYIFESEGIYDSMVDSIESRLRQFHEIHAPHVPFSLESVKKHGVHNRLLDSVGIRSKIETADFSMQGSRPSKIYKFYIPNEKSKTNPHHINVDFTHNEESQYGKPMTSVSFYIDGNEGKKSFPDFSLEKHNAVYSGVMDAVAHHAIDTGQDSSDYYYFPTADVRSEKRAKSRRYKRISQILAGRSNR